MAAIVPDKRNGGCGVIFKGKLYVWGGQTVDKLDLGLELEEGEEAWEDMEIIENLPRPHDTNHPFDVLDLSHMIWSRQSTSGEDHEIPSLGLGSSLVLDPESECFLLFSGYNELKFDAEVYRISPGEWRWEIIKPATDMKPTPRYLTGVIVHNNRLCIFGGVSSDIRPGQDQCATYVPKEENGIALDYGWNNEYYEMDLETSTWSAPLGEVRPHPIGGFAFPKIDPERALLFGGHGSKGRLNEAYLFYLDTREWMGPLKPSSPTSPWPPPTRFPTLTPLISPELVGQALCGCGPELHQRLLLLWGKASSTLVSRETWLLEIKLGSFMCSWKEVSIPLKPRSWHIGLPHYHHDSTECQVVIFGGNMHVRGNSGERDNAADLRILTFGVRTLARSCLAIIAQDPVLMEQAYTLPVGSKFQKMIATAQEMYKNMPPLQYSPA